MLASMSEPTGVYSRLPAAPTPTQVTVVRPQYQVFKAELVQSEVVDGGTSAVLLRGPGSVVPLGAVLVAPTGLSTGRTSA